MDFAVEVVAAAFGVELHDIVGQDGFGLVFMLVMVSHAVHTCSRGITEAALDMVVFGAVMELHVPADRDQQHRKGHQKGTDLQQAFFHVAKVRINSKQYAKNQYFCRIEHRTDQP